ncbi:MAG TPA: O-antigen ligase family protein [Casimicrobiaceae bacterium]
MPLTVLRVVGLGALFLYTLGILNAHSTALRQIGFYVALAVALVLAAIDTRYVARIARQPLAWWLAAVALFAGVSALVSPEPAYSASEAYKAIGFLVLSAFATALIVRTLADANVVMWASVAAAIDVSIYSLVQYAGEFATTPRWPIADIQRHRYYAEPLLWFLPALFWALGRTRDRLVPWVGAGLAVYLLLLAATGARAAWYGGLIAAAMWFYAEANRRRALVVTGALLVAIVLALWIVPEPIFIDQAMRGLWASHRVHGAWLPAIELALERPWLGYGFGENLFHAAYNAEVANHPDWFFRRSLGPHNVFLALWFAGGIGLVASVVGSLLAYYACVGRALAGKRSAWRPILLAGACSMLAYLVIRGSFESIPFRVCGLAFGLALAYAAQRPAPDVREAAQSARASVHARPESS